MKVNIKRNEKRILLSDLEVGQIGVLTEHGRMGAKAERIFTRVYSEKGDHTHIVELSNLKSQYTDQVSMNNAVTLLREGCSIEFII